jgi:hypothetical protein
MGEYQAFPWWVFVYAHWFFDADGHLIDVDVRKIYDSP